MEIIRREYKYKYLNKRLYKYSYLNLALSLVLFFVLIGYCEARSDQYNDYYRGYYTTKLSADTTLRTLTFSDEAYSIIIINDSSSASDIYYTLGTMNPRTAEYNSFDVNTSETDSRTLKLEPNMLIGMNIFCKNFRYKTKIGTATIYITILCKRQVK